MRRGVSFAGVALFVILATTSLFAAPTISSLSPTSGAAGTSVTVSGSNFGNSQGQSTITFGGVAASVSSWHNTSIVAAVPSGVANGAVGVVVTVSNVASNSKSFTISNPVPSITSLSPTSGATGASVTITGTNFGSTQAAGQSTVKFGTATASVSTWSSTSIVVTVPSGLANGAVSVVVTVNANPSNSVSFTINNPVVPSISSLSPTTGPTGTVLTISGSNFGATQQAGNGTVTFNGYFASTYNSWTATSIVVVVPAIAPTGADSVVVTAGGYASSPATFTVTNPSINSISVNGVAMNAAPETQLITINGTNFGASQGTNSSVTFNGTVGVPSSWTNTAITVPVPTGATTGSLVVTANGVASTPYTFMVAPATQPPGVRFIQGDYAIATSVPSSIATPFPIAQTAGNLNVVVVGYSGLYLVNTVTDTAGNTYLLAVGPTAGSSRKQAIYYAKNIAGSASNTVTVTFRQQTMAPAGPLAADIRVAEYSGLDTSAPLDVVAATTNTSNTADSGPATTTNPNDLLVGAAVVDGMATGPGTNYTSRVLPVNYGPTNSDILEDRIVTATGSYNATAPLNISTQWVMQLVVFKERQNQAPVVNAGSNQTITLPTNTATLQGTATDDGLPNNTLAISWTQVSGPGTATFNTPNQAITDATFPVAGTYVLQLTANDSQLSSSATTTVTVVSSNSLVLNPLAAGPNVPGTTQTLTAVLKNGTLATSHPISGVVVSFAVIGPNAMTASATTDSTGTATFSYVGSNVGTDSVVASYQGANSNSVNVSWLVPLQNISIGTINSTFYFTDNPNSGAFDLLPSTAQVAFTLQVPNINFDPIGGINGSPIHDGWSPFTDVTTDVNGNATGTIVAQGNGYAAFAGNYGAFQDVHTGFFTIKAAGPQTICLAADDGSILGVGGGATIPSPNPNPMSGAIPGCTNPNLSMCVTPFKHYPVMEVWNFATYPPLWAPVTIYFPAPGSYPFELDHNECCGGDVSLAFENASACNGTSGGNTGLYSTVSIALTPTSPTSLPTGQNQGFAALLTDATGVPMVGATVSLMVNGANQRQLLATTDSSGHANFQYSGTNAGVDSLQASAALTGMAVASNLVKMTWTVPTGGGSIVFTPQGWIGSPLIGTIIQGQVPITSNVTLSSGTLTYWPTSDPSAVTTLNGNTTGSGTLATFDATRLSNGGYTIQLNATSGGTTQVNQVTVTVVGENKPGRMKTTVTEFKVPLAGIPISITRTYDSVDKSKIEDFGYGWKLGTFVDLSVDAQNNVTFNFNGQKTTFYFTPQPVFLIGAWVTPAYTPQAGTHGSLISNGCSGLIRLSTGLVCFPNTGQLYQPTLYQYTDPVGRVYVMTSAGQLQSIQDLNGNVISITPTGITSSVGGANVTFVRDPQTNRITDIYDTLQNHYQYSYDASGNLQSVQYPGLTATEDYTYDSAHSLLTEKQPGSTNATTAVYYDSTNDGGNSLLDGRLKSITGPTVPDPTGGAGTVNFMTQYSYNLSANTTTITNPDGGTVTRADDSFGNPLTITEQVSTGVSRTTTFQYDSRENLTQVKRPCGYPAPGSCSDSSGNDIWVYTYDANGFQTSMQAPGLPADSKTYNQYGGITSQIDAANRNNVITTYDPNFNPSQVTDNLGGTPGQQVATYSNYDAFGNPQDTTDANGKATHQDFYQTGPQAGYLQDVIRFNNNGTVQEKTSYTYDAMGKVLTTIDACGNGSCPDVTGGTSHTTTNTYDQLERLATVTDAAGFVTKYLYDNNGNKTDQYDAFGSSLQRHTQYQYDNLNRLTQITYPDLTTKQFRYDWRGNKTQEIDQLAHKTLYTYDLVGQLSSVTYAAGTSDQGIISYTYDLDGRRQTVKDEIGQSTGLQTTNTYDPAGRLISVQDPLGNVTSYGYDADGRRTSVMEPNNQQANVKTLYTYDERGRLKRIDYPATPAQPAGTSSLYTYDGMGRVRTSQDQGGQITTKTYDDVGRLISVTDAITPTGNLTQYFYDLNGNLKTLIDAKNHPTTYQYDTMNRRVHRTLPMGQVEDYSYDALGRLSTKTDFNRKTTTYNYDNMDRLLSKVPDPTLGQSTISFTYTTAGALCSASGQRCSMTDASGTTSYGPYDGRDRLTLKQTPEGSLTYTYDAHGNVKSIASSNVNGASLSYTYDALNRLSQVCDKRLDSNCTVNGTGITTYSYDATGNLLGYAYPNTLKTSNVFDPLNRLTQTCSATSSPACSAGTKLSNYQYGLGPAGNRLTVSELGGRQVIYSYDEDYRLTSEAISSDPAGNNGTVSYPPQTAPQPGYDAVGNRLLMTSTLNAVPGGSFSYDANDRLATDGFDANGNTTLQATLTNTYDFENRMTARGPNIFLQYNGDGNRVSETAAGTTTKFLVDDKNPSHLPQVLDEIVNGSVTRTYAYGRSRISENQLIGGNWTPSFYGYDGHGNVRFLANTVPSISDSYDYDAFGMPIRTSGTTPNNYLYSGERFDSGVGLYDLRARYFNQATGRFWARDPVEGSGCFPLTYNPYIYAWDNAVNRIDPWGLASTTWPGAGPSARPAPGTEYLALLVLIASIGPHVQQLGRVIECKAELTASHFGAVFTIAINGGNPLKVNNVNDCEDDLDDCTKRYLKEKAFCWATYGGAPLGTPKRRLMALCYARAAARYRTCQDGNPDPGPLDPQDPEWSNE